MQKELIPTSKGQHSATTWFPNPAVTASTSCAARATVAGPDWLSILATSLLVLVLTDVAGIVISSGIAIEARALQQKPSAP